MKLWPWDWLDLGSLWETASLEGLNAQTCCPLSYDLHDSEGLHLVSRAEDCAWSFCILHCWHKAKCGINMQNFNLQVSDIPAYASQITFYYPTCNINAGKTQVLNSGRQYVWFTWKIAAAMCAWYRYRRVPSTQRKDPLPDNLYQSPGVIQLSS